MAKKLPYSEELIKFAIENFFYNLARLFNVKNIGKLYVRGIMLSGFMKFYLSEYRVSNKLKNITSEIRQELYKNALKTIRNGKEKRALQ